MRRSTSHIHVPARVELFARQMRSALTPSEQQLWEVIRGGRLGVCFRRQVPLGRFIVDFAAPSVSLVVEVDGGYHRPRGTADARRDEKLVRMGWRVLRLPAALVERNLTEAVGRVAAALGG